MSGNGAKNLFATKRQATTAKNKIVINTYRLLRAAFLGL
jgi:hypothetical protein